MCPIIAAWESSIGDLSIYGDHQAMIDKLLWFSSLPMTFSLPARGCESHPEGFHQPKDIFIGHLKKNIALGKLEVKENSMWHSAPIWLWNRTDLRLTFSVTTLRYSERKLMFKAEMSLPEHTFLVLLLKYGISKMP